MTNGRPTFATRRASLARFNRTHSVFKSETNVGVMGVVNQFGERKRESETGSRGDPRGREREIARGGASFVAVAAARTRCRRPPVQGQANKLFDERLPAPSRSRRARACSRGDESRRSHTRYRDGRPFGACLRCRFVDCPSRRLLRRSSVNMLIRLALERPTRQMALACLSRSLAFGLFLVEASRASETLD